MRELEGLITELEKAGEEYARFVDTQSDAEFQHRPGPEDWSVAEMTGHLVEALVTFSEQALQVSRQPGMVIGRDPDDPGRLAAVGTLTQVGPGEAAAAVRDAVRRAVATLRQISPEGWEATAQHRRYGAMQVSGIVERFLIAHAGNHLAQARAAVESAGGQSSTCE